MSWSPHQAARLFGPLAGPRRPWCPLATPTCAALFDLIELKGFPRRIVCKEHGRKGRPRKESASFLAGCVFSYCGSQSTILQRASQYSLLSSAANAGIFLRNDIGC